MLWHLLQDDGLKPKYLASGLPKSGLHLVTAMLQAVCHPMPHTIFATTSWWGTFKWNSFSDQWIDWERLAYLFSRLQHGYFYKGHVGWRADIAEFIRLTGAAHVFIYRDLRDVCVSQTWHILNDDDENFKHVGKMAYRTLPRPDGTQGGFDEVLLAVIEGLAGFTGVIERWELYAPWLDEDWTLALKFEDILADRDVAARRILEYGMDRYLHLFDTALLRVEGEIFDRCVAAMVENSRSPSASSTFRKGTAGQWRECFTEQHKAAFKAHGGGTWLVRLGYEKDEEW